MYGGSAITELGALGAAVGESLVAADLAALVSQKRVARLRNVSSGGSLSSMTGAALPRTAAYDMHRLPADSSAPAATHNNQAE